MKQSISRRSFLVKSSFLGLAGLTACGTKSVASNPSSTGSILQTTSLSPQTTNPNSKFNVLALHSPDHVIAAGRPQRVPVAIVESAETVLLSDDSPIPITINFEGKEISVTQGEAHVASHEHFGDKETDEHNHSNLYRYYPLTITFPQPGVYDLVFELPGEKAMLSIQAFDQQEVKLPLTEDPFPAINNATTKSRLDIDQICTLAPNPCEFHELNAKDLLAARKPFMLLIATPAYCETAYCGPVLETMIKVAAKYPEINYIHSEVYSNTLQVEGNYSDPNIKKANIINDLNLGFEPALFAVNSDGILIDRIDNIFDSKELEAVAERLTV